MQNHWDEARCFLFRDRIFTAPCLSLPQRCSHRRNGRKRDDKIMRLAERLSHNCGALGSYKSSACAPLDSQLPSAQVGPVNQHHHNASEPHHPHLWRACASQARIGAASNRYSCNPDKAAAWLGARRCANTCERHRDCVDYAWTLFWYGDDNGSRSWSHDFVAEK